MIRDVPGRKPRIHPDTWIDPSAEVIGDVVIEQGASVWPGAVLRGDEDNYVRLGKNSNVQDGSVLHVTPEFPCVVGDGVTIGHRAVVHACTVKDNARIGIGAVVLTGAVIEENAQVGAGAVVPPGQDRAGGLAGDGGPRQARAPDGPRRARGDPAQRDGVRRALAPRLRAAPRPPLDDGGAPARTDTAVSTRGGFMPLRTRYLFSAAMDVDPSREALFHEVYDKEHIPALLEVPGVVSAARFKVRELTLMIGGERKTIDPQGAPRYNALYELESPEVLVTAAWARAVERGRWPSRGPGVHPEPPPPPVRAPLSQSSGAPGSDFDF